MPRTFGGHTELGSALNRNSQQLDHSKVSRINTKRAIIHKSLKGQYIFYMKLLDQEGRITAITGPIPIVGSSDDLVSRYGSPEEMENNWEVLITYKGTTVNRGVAQVTSSIGTKNNKTEEVEQANQLLVKGTAFAPPGPGV